jgi:hypothetical protein
MVIQRKRRKGDDRDADEVWPPRGRNGMSEPGRVPALDRLIDAYLGGSASFDAFAAEYGVCYIDLPDDAFPDVDAEVWYGVLHERIEWTAPDPDPESRAYGWISADEFRQWLEPYVRDRRARPDA